MEDTVGGGFDPNEWWSNNTATADQKVGNVNLIGIQCEACHGAGSDHVGLTDEEKEENPMINGNPSVEESCMGIGVSGQKGMAGVTCVDCHMWNTPSLGHGVYMSDSLNSERHETHSFEPTAQACADCHTNILDTMPEHGRPANNTGENEELWNEWDEWGMEWNETVEMYEMIIHDWQENWERLFEEVEHNYAAAEQALVDAEANGTKSTETIAEAQALLDDAVWNIGVTISRLLLTFSGH